MTEINQIPKMAKCTKIVEEIYIFPTKITDTVLYL